MIKAQEIMNLGFYLGHLTKKDLTKKISGYQRSLRLNA